MPTPPTGPPDAGPPPGDRAALARLREAPNPFAFTVAAAGTDADCVAFDVPDLFRDQLSDLKGVIEQYRRGRPQTRVFPVIGDSGAGKTHLLSLLRADLRREAESGAESLVVGGDYFSLQTDAGDFLLWQMVNHLRDSKGAGHRLLQAVAGRLAGRLLAEAIRRLAPPAQAGLIPSAGLVERFRMALGSGAVAERRRDAVRAVVEACEAPDVATDRLRAVFADSGVNAAAAERLVADHLAATELNNADGWIRRELYRALVGVALRGDWEGFNSFHDGGYQEGPANVTDAGRPARRLLVAWIDLLDRLHVPVVLVFDQLEDFLRAETREREQEVRRLFTQAVVGLANAVADVCILLFAEEGLWNDVVQGMDRYSAARFVQEFSLPGKPARRYIAMPTSVPRDAVLSMIRTRRQFAAPGYDFGGLPAEFPFSEARLRELGRVTTPRDCLRKLSEWYNDLVFPDMSGCHDKLRESLRASWQRAVAAAKAEHGQDCVSGTAKILGVQTAFDGWLRALAASGIGTLAHARVELVQDPRKGQYGYLNVIRTGGPGEPGIGIAAWLAEGGWRAFDLQQRLGFFDATPAPIRTLILFRRDGREVLAGKPGQVFDKALRDGLDVRVVKLEPRHVQAAFAFPKWHQMAIPEVEAAGGDADRVYRAVLADISRELLAWVEDWRKPPTGAPE